MAFPRIHLKVDEWNRPKNIRFSSRKYGTLWKLPLQVGIDFYTVFKKGSDSE